MRKSSSLDSSEQLYMQNGGLQQVESLEFVMVDVLKCSVSVNHVCPLCSSNLETVPFWLTVFPWRRQKLVGRAKKWSFRRQMLFKLCLPQSKRDPASWWCSDTSWPPILCVGLEQFSCASDRLNQEKQQPSALDWYKAEIAARVLWLLLRHRESQLWI